MRYRLRRWTVTALLLMAGPATAAPLDAALGLLRAGSYARAEAALGKLLRGRTRGRALLALGRLQLETGRPGAALRAADKVPRGKLRARARTLAAEAQIQLGKLEQAERTLEAVTRAHPRHHRAWILLGLVYHRRGDVQRAKAVFNRFYDEYDAGRIDKGSAEQLTYVAMACRYSDNFRDAADTLDDAVKADPKYLPAHVQLGEISLEKYEAGHAEQHYGRALKINPHHAGALVGLARVKLEQSGDYLAARELLRRVDKIHPRMIEGSVLRAEMLLNEERSLEAEALLTKALARRPQNLEALSMLGASFFLRDDLGSFERTRAKVLGLNPRYTAFYRTAVRLGERRHRYAEILKLSQRALKLDPQDWYSLADLGVNYLRMGDDQRGLKYLREAWKGDRYNVRTYNLLNLFEDVLAKEYVFIRSKHFKLRVHRQEQQILRQTVVPLLERGWRTYVKKYGFTPRAPVTVELFRDPKHYAIRTVGLPGLHALGVCFGQVITSVSPTNGRFNWGQVLWHELNHVFTIQLSRSRVPRWLTEGLADMEPALERAEWSREKGLEVYRALKAGKLKPIEQLNTAFTQARNMEQMELAYVTGNQAALFLVKRWGLPKVLQGLRLFARGQRVQQVLPRITGLSMARLNREFLNQQRRELQRYAANWLPDLTGHRDLEARRQAARARPGDVAAQAALALAQLQAGQIRPAAATAKKVLAGDKNNREALYVQVRLALKRGDAPRARKALERLAAAGGDSYLVRLSLAQLALAGKDLPRARRQLQRALKLDPDADQPHLMLARIHQQQGHTDRVIKELKAYTRLNQHDFSASLKLVKLLAGLNRMAEVRQQGRRAYYIQPASPELYTLLARAYRAAAPRPRLDRAVHYLELALLSQPPKPADLYLELARVHLQRGDRKAARKQLKRALKINPGHPGARALLKKL
jgi:tetratricopeptide (TPR) repeat protein